MSNLKYVTGSFLKGQNYYYSLSWVYNEGGTRYWGPVLFKRSTDAITWSSPTDLFGTDIRDANPSMCVYATGASDVIYIMSLAPSGSYDPAVSTAVLRSVDNGTTFTRLANMPFKLMLGDIRTNASWTGIDNDSDIYAIGGRYTQNDPQGDHSIAVSLIKSTDNGNSWRQISDVTDDWGMYPKLFRDNNTLVCVYMNRMDINIYVRTSSDWGHTWSAEKAVYTRVNDISYSTGLQKLGGGKYLLTITDINLDRNLSRGVYGYFWTSNLTFKQMGYVTGPEFCIGDDTFVGILETMNGVTTLKVMFSSYKNDGEVAMKMTSSTDMGLTWDMPHIIPTNGGDQNFDQEVSILPYNWIQMTVTWSNYTIKVQTNSTVLECKFDKENKTFEMKVQGPEGSIGGANILFPKSLCNLSAIRIKFDGGNLTYNVSENSTSYLIKVTYHHSTHDLIVDFNAYLPPSGDNNANNGGNNDGGGGIGGSTPLPIIVIVATFAAGAVAICILLAIISYMRKQRTP